MMYEESGVIESNNDNEVFWGVITDKEVRKANAQCKRRTTAFCNDKFSSLDKSTLSNWSGSLSPVSETFMSTSSESPLSNISNAFICESPNGSQLSDSSINSKNCLSVEGVNSCSDGNEAASIAEREQCTVSDVKSACVKYSRESLVSSSDEFAAKLNNPACMQELDPKLVDRLVYVNERAKHSVSGLDNELADISLPSSIDTGHYSQNCDVNANTYRSQPSVRVADNSNLSLEILAMQLKLSENTKREIEYPHTVKSCLSATDEVADQHLNGNSVGCFQSVKSSGYGSIEHTKKVFLLVEEDVSSKSFSTECATPSDDCCEIPNSTYNNLIKKKDCVEPEPEVSSDESEDGSGAFTNITVRQERKVHRTTIKLNLDSAIQESDQICALLDRSSVDYKDGNSCDLDSVKLRNSVHIEIKDSESWLPSISVSEFAMSPLQSVISDNINKFRSDSATSPIGKEAKEICHSHIHHTKVSSEADKSSASQPEIAEEYGTFEDDFILNKENKECQTSFRFSETKRNDDDLCTLRDKETTACQTPSLRKATKCLVNNFVTPDVTKFTLPTKSHSDKKMKLVQPRNAMQYPSPQKLFNGFHNDFHSIVSPVRKYIRSSPVPPLMQNVHGREVRMGSPFQNVAAVRYKKPLPLGQSAAEVKTVKSPTVIRH